MASGTKGIAIIKKLTIKRIFSAPIDDIWKAFTTPEILVKWWSPEGMSLSYISADLRDGGLFRYCFKGSDGTGFWGRGVYQAVAEPTRISYLDTFTDAEGNPVPPSHYGMAGDTVIESTIDISLSEDGGRTHMNITMDNYYDESMTDHMTKGWNVMFDKLTQILDSRP